MRGHTHHRQHTAAGDILYCPFSAAGPPQNTSKSSWSLSLDRLLPPNASHLSFLLKSSSEIKAERHANAIKLDDIRRPSVDVDASARRKVSPETRKGSPCATALNESGIVH